MIRPNSDPRALALRQRAAEFLAWGVHLYTASGLVAAAGIAILIVRGGAESFYWSLILMWVATVIDATDGVMARRLRVKEVLPGFDGRRLDDLTDFQTYTSLPLLLLWRAGILPTGMGWVLLIPLLASAYGFCQSDAKTDDGYFLGFPSYWNLVAMYLMLLQPPTWLTVTLIVGFSTLTFVPARYLYPSQPGKLNQLTNVLGAAWAVFVVWILYRLASGQPAMYPPPADIQRLALISFAYPAYDLIASWAISLKLLRRK